MKNFSKLALLTFSLWSCFSWAECPPNYFKFYCRGGGDASLQNQTGYKQTVVTGRFFRNPQPFTNGGPSAIGPGRCTWNDRVLYDNEPSQFQFRVYNDSIGPKVTFELLAQCASNQHCWFDSCASNNGSSFLQLYPDDFTTNFEK
ncbi:MAG: hypothetical protein ACHQYQ_06040 [Bacteriovoracales bacterium]